MANKTWFEKELKGSELKTTVWVSNEDVPLPDGLQCRGDFLAEQEQEHILNELSEADFVWKGFEVRKRVWRFSLPTEEGDEDVGESNNNAPSSLLALAQRLQQETGLQATDVAVEEYPVAKWNRTGEYASHLTVTTFESLHLTYASDSTITSTVVAEDWFVAHIPLNKAAIQHVNEPAKRLVNSWTLKSKYHQTDVWMEPKSLWIKTGPCLRDWRHQLRADDESDNKDSVLVVKLSRLPQPSQADGSRTFGNSDNNSDDQFGYKAQNGDDDDAKQQQHRPKDMEMPPLHDLLTILITTSPVRSNPSTDLIERIMKTFLLGGEDFARCRKVIVCDGFRVANEDSLADGSVTKRHGSNIKQAMRNGIVTDDQAERYRQFKQKLRRLCHESSSSSSDNDDDNYFLFQNTTVEELDERQGYGFALRHALKNRCVTTQFVCVIQHDRTFMRPTPMTNVLRCMWQYPNIKYVGISMRSNVSYQDLFLQKYGKVHMEELSDMILRPPELLVDQTEYGPNSQSAKAMEDSCSKKIWKSILSVAESYQSSHQCLGQQEWLRRNPPPSGKHQMSLIPTIFWYDNIHVCETAHYRDFVFHPSYKMVARGGFVEDKLSPVLIRTVERLGLKEGHSRFGCYLLDDHSGFFFTGHLDGGSYMTDEQRQAAYLGKSESGSGPKKNTASPT